MTPWCHVLRGRPFSGPMPQQPPTIRTPRSTQVSDVVGQGLGGQVAKGPIRVLPLAALGIAGNWSAPVLENDVKRAVGRLDVAVHDRDRHASAGGEHWVYALQERTLGIPPPKQHCLPIVAKTTGEADHSRQTRSPKDRIGCDVARPGGQRKYVRYEFGTGPVLAELVRLKCANTGNRSVVRNRPRSDYRDFLAAMNAEISACFQCIGQPRLLMHLEQRPCLHEVGPVQALSEPGINWGE